MLDQGGLEKHLGRASKISHIKPGPEMGTKTDLVNAIFVRAYLGESWDKHEEVYDATRDSINFKFASIDEALSHPQTIPFLGGRERAEKYLKKALEYSAWQQRDGKGKIESAIFFDYYDDKVEHPSARLLHLLGSFRGPHLSVSYDASYDYGTFFARHKSKEETPKEKVLVEK